MASEIRLRPDKRLTAADVEEWLVRVARASSVELALGAWRSSGMLADAYLQGLLALLRRQRVKIDVAMPATSFVGDRLAAAFCDPRRERGPGFARTPETLTPTERVLGGTLGGLIVGHVAGLPNSAVIARQRAAAADGMFGVGAESAVTSLVDPGPALVPLPGDARLRYERLRRDMRRLLQVLNAADQKAFGDNGREATPHFERMLQFAFEAYENTSDHGQFDFDRQALAMVRFVQLRRIDIGETSTGLQRLTATLDEATADFVARIGARFDAVETPRPRRRLIELTVGDGGLGIPAWLSDDLEIYGRPHQEEMKYLCEALLPDRTTKALWESGRGQGFMKMLRSAHALRGLVLIRTGRSAISRAYLSSDGSDEDVDFDDVQSNAYEVRRSGELPLTAGTVVSLMFPLPHSV